MTNIAVSRAGRTVLAAREVTDLTIRSHECRNVQSAIELHWKLTSDPAFEAWRALEGDPKSSEGKPHCSAWPVAAGILIARGQVTIVEDRLAIQISEFVKRTVKRY